MLEPIVTPSSQVQSALPQYIAEQYPKFVYFMQRALASSERQGFAQDLLQNLLKYRDFDYYKKPIVETGVLEDFLTADETESLKLMDTYGFPETNGVILIDTDLINKITTIKEKYRSVNNVKIFNHIEFQQYMIENLI